MSAIPTLDQAIDDIPRAFAGPGGAIAVLKDGQVLARHAWGFADLARRLAFTPATPFLICSISKQFTCATMLNEVGSPEALDGMLAARMPHLATVPTTRDLANNQSGLRDYWALTSLAGSPVEAPFDEAQARALIARTRTLHFAPGTRYSYCNQNFRLIGDMVAERAGRPLGELMARVFDRAGMAGACLSPDTAAVPGGTQGYEGSLEDGFRPAVNRITWTGDAGVAATLDDMIAWERHVDATRDDPAGLYTRLAAPATFRDGAIAGYGLGLARPAILGRATTGHGGGLRGWRSFRFYAQAERISVVVLFNHLADPRAAAQRLFAAALGEAPPPPPAAAPAISWGGRYIEPETGLATRIEALADGRARLHFSGSAETLAPHGDGLAGGGVRLWRQDGVVRMVRATDNIATTLQPATGAPATDIAGTFHAAEQGADLTVAASGGAFYAACAGALGQGAMVPLVPFAGDTWLMPCPRSLDYSPPGDWTLTFRRNPAGQVDGVRVGCWLARGVEYRRQ